MTDTEPQDEGEGKVTKYGEIGPPCFDPQTGLWRLRYMPFAPSPKQAAFLGTTCRELFYGGAAGGGKALKLDTPILTPDGFRQIGNLHPGDYTFGADGKIHTIVGETEVFTADGWALTFDTGETVVVNDQHLWVTRTDTERRAGQDGTVRSTFDVVSSLGDGHIVAGAAPVQLPSASLPGDPYKVGRRFTWDPATLIGEYVLGSETQRLSFLQGMLDETGDVKPGSNSVVLFTHPDSAVSNVAAFLVRTLGMKTAVTQVNGEWAAEFRANTRHVFRDKTKQSRLKHGLKQTRMWHRIVDAVRVCDIEFKCIQTSAADHQYLAGTHLIPTHNSVALLAAALQFADVPGYAALILRRNLTDLTQPGALIAMSRQWLDGRPDCTYNANERKWTFKNGGVVQFGYLNHVQDLGRYKGPLRPETEVLTDNGWTPICDVNVGDRVASFDPKTRAAGMQPVSATHEWDYDDDLVTVHQRSGVSFAATPDHTIWYRTEYLKELRRGRVGEVASSLGRFWVPRNGTWSDGTTPEPRVFVSKAPRGTPAPTLRFSPMDWMEFLGLYAAEGHVGVGGDRHAIQITLKPGRRKRTESLLNRVGANWSLHEGRQRYTFRNSVLAGYLRDHCGTVQKEKRLPRDVFGFAPEYRRRLLDTVVKGGRRFESRSGQLSDDVSELATRCGLVATSTTRFRPNVFAKPGTVPSPLFLVTLSDRGHRDTKVVSEDVQREHYTGKVHCLTVAPWHSIIIRYKGRVSVTGNTEYHYIAFDELSEFPLEYTYTYMFSRLRRPKGLSRDEIIRLYGQSPDGLTLLDLPLRVRAASNPSDGPGGKWAKERFVDVPTRQAPFMPATFRDNPAIDDEEYLMSLAMLPEIERRRLELGDWSVQEVPGALWTLAGISRFDWSREQGTSMFDRVYIGLDPSVGEGAGDECGIVAGGIRSSGQVVVLEDGSIRAHPDIWSQRAVTLYHVLDASGIVIEKNQGAELLRTQIRDAADQLGMPQPVVHLANAKGSKEWRAGTITSGYTNPIGNPLIKHATGLAGGELEAQMVGWVPGSRSQTVKSPDRVDGLVWMLRGLLYPNDLDDFSKTVSTPGGLVDKFRSW